MRHAPMLQQLNVWMLMATPINNPSPSSPISLGFTDDGIWENQSFQNWQIFGVLLVQYDFCSSR